MTEEDVLRMAREAWGNSREIFWFEDGGIERFAALVAAVEREACAKVCENYGESCDTEWNQKLGVADDLRETAEECAEAIRARGTP
jgi:hypothetical protein